MSFDGLLGAIIGLVVPFPGARDYYPLGIALRDFLIGDIGHGPRVYWVAVAFAVWVVYAMVGFGIFRLMRFVAARFR